MATTEGSAMQSFQTHIEDMRSLTLCKICLKPFFEPYIISCGHTYCYSCLRSWFGNTADRRRAKSCPDCRITVKVQPAPNYLLRDLTHMFVSRAELLPEDESLQEHARDREEAAAQLAKDREGLGLFQGVFKQISGLAYMPGPIRDFEDNVERCPYCNWELEDGICSRCGIDMHGSDFSTDSADTIDPPGVGSPRHAFYGVASDSDEDDSEDESNLSGPDEYDRHDDFLDNENEDDADDIDEDDFYPQFPARSSTPNDHFHRSENSNDDDDDDDNSEEDEGPLPATRRAGRRHLGVGVSSPNLTEDSATNYDVSDDEQDYRFMNGGWGSTALVDGGQLERPLAASALNRRRPVVISDDEDEESDNMIRDSSHNPSASMALPVSDDDDMDSDSNSSNSRSEPEDSDDSEQESGHPSEETGDSEDSDDTIQPPQSRRRRQERLQNQRARRPLSHARGSTMHSSTTTQTTYSFSGRGNSLAQHGRRGRATRVY